ncbi:MAG: hypothetical protein ACI8V2_003212 [Candidatus Latescibacterota bacterium]|jgi:hypothetical protein
MRRIYQSALAILFFATQALASSFMQGTPDIKAFGSLAFGPDGILFVGDAQNATIYAIDLNDKTPNNGTEQLRVRDIDEKIAGLMGATAKDIQIHDLAVNPISQNVYISVTRGNGNDAVQALLRIVPSGDIEDVSLQNVKYATKEIVSAVSADAKDRRGRSLRSQAITDLAYSSGKLFVAGLSNEEFSSTLRTISYPFDDNETVASLEIYHAAHKKYETNSPIRTLMTYTLGNEPHVLAAYTCTPLVTIPIVQLQNGSHVKGKTVGELGSGNRPLDMIAYKSGGKEYILLANNNRALMKIDPANIEITEAITTPVTERYGTRGVPFINTNQVGVQQLDNLNVDHVIILQRMSNGSLNLNSLSKDRL